MFLQRFLISNLWNALLVCVMLGLKRLLRDRVSLRFQYRVWYVLPASLLASFLPGSFWQGLQAGGVESKQNFAIRAANGAAGRTGASGDGWLYDAAQLAGDSGSDWLSAAVLSVWLLGVIVMLVVYGCGICRLRRLRRNAAEPSEELGALFQSCSFRTRMRGMAELKTSRRISAPVSFGVWPPVVMLPQESLEGLPETELRHILLHELTHIRHGDLIANYLVCIVQALFWCNPAVWAAMDQLRRDREAYCDWAVINSFDSEEERLGYGRTVLHFAAVECRDQFDIANGFCQGKSQLKYRLEQIVGFRKETRWGRAVCGVCGAALVLISAGQIPVLALCAENGEKYAALDEALNIREADFGSLFAEKDGCAVVYDLNADSYLVYNRDEITRRLPPCSTYKIYSALNALELGIITPEASTLVWDGTRYGSEAWNADQNLNEAMGNSTNWYFQELDCRAGLDRLTEFYRKIGYGNCRVGGDVSTYWNGSALRISALEQVELLVKLYRNDFGVRDENLRTVLDAMGLFRRGDTAVYGKTGTGQLEGTNVAGWFVGFAEKAGNVYFFAVYLCAENGGDGAAAADTAFAILEQLEIL